MAENPIFPYNIPPEELYSLREAPATGQEELDKAMKELREKYAKNEALLRSKIDQLKQQLNLIKTQPTLPSTMVPEPLIFIPVKEKILAADGSSQQDYYP